MRKKAIQLAKELNAVAVEAQSYYSMGHCFTILNDYESGSVYGTALLYASVSQSHTPHEAL
ncbi:hypothetical protein M513_12944 [Trichuris suis]|uniref:Uncharacterized protein n=1 Tax=Trichuris suis TaxID=68888 RepID=A0A085LMH4_9BILA|nr:hypothetical protein M513_12944 [Trichuris suis]